MKNSYKKILLCGCMLGIFSLQTMHAELVIPKGKVIENLTYYKIAQDITDGLKGEPSSFSDAKWIQEIQGVMNGGMMSHIVAMKTYPDGENYMESVIRQLESMGEVTQKKCDFCMGINNSYKNSTCGSIKCCNKNICMTCFKKAARTDQECPSCKSKMNWNTLARHVAKK